MKIKLSQRQAEIAEYVAQGMTYKEIAATTGLAVKTVEAHVYIAASRLSGRGYPQHKLTLWVLSTDENT